MFHNAWRRSWATVTDTVSPSLRPIRPRWSVTVTFLVSQVLLLPVVVCSDFMSAPFIWNSVVATRQLNRLSIIWCSFWAVLDEMNPQNKRMRREWRWDVKQEGERQQAMAPTQNFFHAYVTLWNNMVCLSPDLPFPPSLFSISRTLPWFLLRQGRCGDLLWPIHLPRSSITGRLLGDHGSSCLLLSSTEGPSVSGGRWKALWTRRCHAE